MFLLFHGQPHHLEREFAMLLGGRKETTSTSSDELGLEKLCGTFNSAIATVMHVFTKPRIFDVTTSYNSMEPAARTKNERKNMTYAALPRSEAFHSRLEVQVRARNERLRGTFGLRVRYLSLSYLSERCVRVDSFYTIHVYNTFKGGSSFGARRGSHSQVENL
ncbi:jg4508 [Pararge aegeria aegeria]|uniref:Jg4508 protein n=1 Tax=Pararge aegeria aegeria TaxID=348720 RepID=A0A8S4RFC3_9NEOP|nr:jg4508 [Pararge aegeria aegeria]